MLLYNYGSWNKIAGTIGVNANCVPSILSILNDCLYNAPGLVLLCLHFLVLWDYRVQLLFESRVALKPGLGGLMDVASAIIYHEQTQSNCCFQTLDVVFPKDLISDYFGLLKPRLFRYSGTYFDDIENSRKSLVPTSIVWAVISYHIISYHIIQLHMH